MAFLDPSHPAEVVDIIRAHASDRKPLAIQGQGTKAGLGRLVTADDTLSLRSLSGIVSYQPEELVLTAKSGTPLREITEALVAKRQHLAFEPIASASLFGPSNEGGSIGGVLAANLAGPRRPMAGSARDHFLGFSAVSGRGETFKSGGRVVKNVTGYDLCKLMAGSWGTLAALTEVTIKVLPRPETEETIVIFGLDEPAAIRAMGAAMGSPYEVSGAAHLPAGIAVRIPGPWGSQPVTALRLEGVGVSVVHRRRTLRAEMRPHGALALLAEQESRAFWRKVRDVEPFAAESVKERPVWRISTVPSKGAELARMVASQVAAEFVYDWAGGLVWAAAAPASDAGEAAVRAAVAAFGGHATLVRAPAAVRAVFGAFEPQDQGLAALTKRVKEGFDPKGVLNPGRMWAGV